MIGREIEIERRQAAFQSIERIIIETKQPVQYVPEIATDEDIEYLLEHHESCRRPIITNSFFNTDLGLEKPKEKTARAINLQAVIDSGHLGPHARYNRSSQQQAIYFSDKQISPAKLQLYNSGKIVSPMMSDASRCLTCLDNVLVSCLFDFLVFLR